MDTRFHCKCLRLAALVVMVVIISHVGVRGAEELDCTVSWLGNSFSGANDKWVQSFFIHIKVQPDGTVNTWSHSDEGGRRFGVYKHHDVIGNEEVEINSLRTTDNVGRSWQVEFDYGELVGVLDPGATVGGVENTGWIVSSQASLHTVAKTESISCSLRMIAKQKCSFIVGDLDHKS